MMTEPIGAFEAKNRLSELLERVRRGEEVVITKRGRPVAKLVPIEGGRDAAQVRDAVAGIRTLARELSAAVVDWDEWKTFRDDGRR